MALVAEELATEAVGVVVVVFARLVAMVDSIVAGFVFRSMSPFLV